MKTKKADTPFEFYMQNPQLESSVNAADNFENYCAQLQREIFPAFSFDDEHDSGQEIAEPLDLEAQIADLEAVISEQKQQQTLEVASADVVNAFTAETELLAQRLKTLFDCKAFDAHIAEIAQCEPVQPLVVDAFVKLGERLQMVQNLTSRLENCARAATALEELEIDE